MHQRFGYRSCIPTKEHPICHIIPISFPYHSHIPHDGQVLWQCLRRRADAVLAGEIPWTRESWVEQISEELLSVDFDDI